MEAFNSIVTLLDDKVWFILMFLLVGTGAISAFAQDLCRCVTFRRPGSGCSADFP